MARMQARDVHVPAALGGAGAHVCSCVCVHIYVSIYVCVNVNLTRIDPLRKQ
jgi:hypothetical protein